MNTSPAKLLRDFVQRAANERVRHAFVLSFCSWEVDSSSKNPEAQSNPTSLWECVDCIYRCKWCSFMLALLTYRSCRFHAVEIFQKLRSMLCSRTRSKTPQTLKSAEIRSRAGLISSGFKALGTARKNQACTVLLQRTMLYLRPQ